MESVRVAPVPGGPVPASPGPASPGPVPGGPGPGVSDSLRALATSLRGLPRFQVDSQVISTSATRPRLMQTHNENQIELVTEAIDSLELSVQKKLSIKHRFISLLEEYTFRSNRYSRAFHSLRLIISVGSLIVPALLSVQFTGGSSSTGSSSTEVSVSVYWVVWVLSLCVTISNAVMTLMKIDKKYYTLHTTLHQIVSEGWLYIELSGKYSGYNTPGEAPTHDNQFVYFCHSLEKIRMKQVGDEYYKLPDANQQNAKVNEGSQLIPPTPMRLPFTTEVEEKSKEEVNGPKTTVTIQEDA